MVGLQLVAISSLALTISAWSGTFFIIKAISAGTSSVVLSDIYILFTFKLPQPTLV